MSETLLGAVAANPWLLALAATLIAAQIAWLVSIFRGDVSIIDGLWSLLILLSVSVYAGLRGSTAPQAWLVIVLVTIWALRLSIHITVRNYGRPEDRRYQQIRRNNQPHFWLKSLFIVFLLQGFLAWVISLPALAAVSGQASTGPFTMFLTSAGVFLWAVGMIFEAIGDWQLARFRRSRPDQGAVLDSGLWRYTRHPNYFGEALLWWGIWLLALAAGAWWSAVSPLLLTFLLLRVSGVRLLEKDIAERRPAYRDYVRRTNAFVPGPRRAAAARPDGG